MITDDIAAHYRHYYARRLANKHGSLFFISAEKPQYSRFISTACSISPLTPLDILKLHFFVKLYRDRASFLFLTFFTAHFSFRFTVALHSRRYYHSHFHMHYWQMMPCWYVAASFWCKRCYWYADYSRWLFRFFDISAMTLQIQKVKFLFAYYTANMHYGARFLFDFRHFRRCCWFHMSDDF